MSTIASFREQVQRNLVALISLAVAISSLAYNSWHNERAEINHNLRAATFEMLMHLGELQLVADYRHYQDDTDKGNPITGWGHAAIIRDLGTIMPDPMPGRAARLFVTWQANVERLGRDEEGAEQIAAAIRETREEALRQLDMLH